MKTYHDIVGDGGSDIVGQVVAQKQAIAAALTGVRHLIAIGSGKGGVGKSTLTMALAQALRQAGRTVAILDGDLNGPCQAHLAGLAAVPWVPDGRSFLTLPRRADGIGVLSLGSVLPAARPIELSSVAPGDDYTWRAIKEFTLLAQLLASVAWGELDFLLVDLPPGADRTRHFVQFLDPRTRLLLVTIPSELAHGVVARSIAAIPDDAGDHVLGYVLNMAGYFCRACGEIRPLFPAPQTSLGIPCLGEVPFDPALADHCDRGWPVPLAADSLPLRAIAAVAQRLLTQLSA